MSTIGEAAAQALALVTAGDPKLVAIVLLSLRVSLAAVVFGALIGLPFGAWVAVTDFPGRRAVIVMLNALMGLPSVVVGLVVYLLLSRAGPLGSWGILFTPTAMVIAQTILIAPIIAALSRQIEQVNRDLLAERLGRVEDLELVVDLVSTGMAELRRDTATLAALVDRVGGGVDTVLEKLDQPLQVTVERPSHTGVRDLFTPTDAPIGPRPVD